MKRHIVFTLTTLMVLFTLMSAVTTATCEKEADSACYVKTVTHMDFVAPAGGNNLICRVYKQYNHCVAYYSGDNLVAEIGHEIVHGECSLCGYQDVHDTIIDLGSIIIDDDRDIANEHEDDIISCP